MFDPVAGERYQPRRVVDPPRRVLVDLRALFGPTRIRWGKETPIWVRSVGLQVGDQAPGELSEWWLTSVGDWVGLVRCEVRIGDRRESVTLLVPAAAIRDASQG